MIWMHLSIVLCCSPTLTVPNEFQHALYFSTATFAMQCSPAVLLPWVGRVIWHWVKVLKPATWVPASNLLALSKSLNILWSGERLCLCRAGTAWGPWTEGSVLDVLTQHPLFCCLWFPGVCAAGAPKMEIERQDWDWWQPNVGWGRKGFYTTSPREVWNQGVVYNGWIGISGLIGLLPHYLCVRLSSICQSS